MHIDAIEELGGANIDSGNSFKQREDELDLVEYENLVGEKENLNSQNGGDFDGKDNSPTISDSFSISESLNFKDSPYYTDHELSYALFDQKNGIQR